MGKLLQRLAVQHGLDECVALVAQLQGEERDVPGDQLQKDGVPRPVGKRQKPVMGNPFQRPFVALLQLPGPAAGNKCMYSVGQRSETKVTRPR